ncbi:unnamed protein product [Ectocarpus sp. 12 AP-2014]
MCQLQSSVHRRFLLGVRAPDKPGPRQVRLSSCSRERRTGLEIIWLCKCACLKQTSSSGGWVGGEENTPT